MLHNAAGFGVGPVVSMWRQHIVCQRTHPVHQSVHCPSCVDWLILPDLCLPCLPLAAGRDAALTLDSAAEVLATATAATRDQFSSRFCEGAADNQTSITFADMKKCLPAIHR